MLISPGEKADSRSKAENVQDELEQLEIQTAREINVKDYWSQVKTLRSPLEEVPRRQR